MNNETVFRYNYSAAQNQEVLAIRSKYLPREESKFEELQRLDRCVQRAGMVQGLTVGIVGCLIFGLGMCLAMQVIGNSMLLGVLVGLGGVLVMLAAYPIHRAVFRRAKETYKPRILELTSELSGVQTER